MIMQRNDGGRKRAANHPWNHPETRAKASETPVEPRVHSVTMRVNLTELRAIRARAQGTNLSEFVRTNLPEDIFQPPEQGT